jgi:hypothetical protein
MQVVERHLLEALAAEVAAPETQPEPELTPGHYSQSGQGIWGHERHPEITREEVETALRYIPAQDYEEWLTVGMSVHDWSGGSTEGLELWDRWSQTVPEKYDADEIRKKWASFGQPNGKSRTIGSLIHLAREKGWKRGGKNLKSDAELSAGLPFPTDALPGPLRKFVEQIAAAIQCPLEFVGLPLLVAAGMAIGAALCIRLKHGWMEYPGVYMAIVAIPGTAKSPAFKHATEPVQRRVKQLRSQYEGELVEYELALSE